MKLFTGDIKKLEQRIIELDQLSNRKMDKDTENIANYSFFELMVIYRYIVGIRLAKRKLILKRRTVPIHEDEKIRVKNFLDNKDFHHEIISIILDQVADDMDEFKFFEENINYSEDEMYNLIMKFLDSIESKELLLQVVNSKTLFCKNVGLLFDGIQVFDWLDKTSYILIDKNISDMTKIISIIHELGHSYDSNNLNSSNDLINYSKYSPYTEVMSKNYEKKFLDFLLDKKIGIKDAANLLESYYGNTIDSLKNIFLLTDLDDKYIEGNSYKRLKFNKLVKLLDNTESMQYLDNQITNFEDIDVTEDLRYGYGGILSCYFNYLERNDPEKYKYMYNNFLNYRTFEFNEDYFYKFVENNDILATAVKEEITSDLRKVEKELKLKRK